MASDGNVRAGAATARGDADFTIFGGEVSSIAASDIRRAIQRVREGEATEVARDRNSICYRVPWASETGGADMAIVKAPRAGPQRTNGDITFAGEATIVARLPEAGIAHAYRLLARVKAGGDHFLLTTHVPGAHPDPLRHPFDARALPAFFGTLFAMDRQGLMHYDLKPANILLDGQRHGLIDFEFSRFEPWHDAFAKATSAYCEDFNVSPNPCFPARTNVANFEFRTLFRYLAGLEQARSAMEAETFFRDYLREKSRYHTRMASHLAGLAPDGIEQMSARAGIASEEVRRRLAKAAAYENTLAALMHEARRSVIDLERSLLGFRHDVFERQREQADVSRRKAFEQTRHRVGADRLPAEYVDAMNGTFERVWRSRPPP